MANVLDSRADCVRKDGMTTRHELAIRVLLRSDPEIHRNGFKAAMRALYASDDECELPAIDFLPDAYKLDEELQRVVLFEVEDSNPISPSKLYKLANLWFDMDSDGPEDWEVQVRIVDRYGRDTGPIDLAGFFHCGALEHAASLPTEIERLGV